MSPISTSLAVFAMVVLVVALNNLAHIRSLEIDVQHKLHAQEMEHQRKMKELDLELQRIRQGSRPLGRHAGLKPGATSVPVAMQGDGISEHYTRLAPGTRL